MNSNLEVVVLGCHEEDVETLQGAAGASGPRFIVLNERAEFAGYAVSHGVLAVFLGIGPDDLQSLELLRIIHAVKKDLPVIVIAETDSLEVERRARQEKIFYYLVHPVTEREASAVLGDVVKFAGGRG